MAESPVMVDYCEDGGWQPTQYQAADCRCLRAGLIAIAAELAATAMECPVDDVTDFNVTTID
jgi:hypothetical protein